MKPHEMDMVARWAALILRMMTGAPYRVLAYLLGCTHQTVRHHCGVRKRSINRKKQFAPTPEQRQRYKLRAMAREEARERGVHPKEVYEQWGCQ